MEKNSREGESKDRRTGTETLREKKVMTENRMKGQPHSRQDKP